MTGAVSGERRGIRITNGNGNCDESRPSPDAWHIPAVIDSESTALMRDRRVDIAATTSTSMEDADLAEAPHRRYERCGRFTCSWRRRVDSALRWSIFVGGIATVLLSAEGIPDFFFRDGGDVGGGADSIRFDEDADGSGAFIGDACPRRFAALMLDFYALLLGAAAATIEGRRLRRPPGHFDGWGCSHRTGWLYFVAGTLLLSNTGVANYAAGSVMCLAGLSCVLFGPGLACGDDDETKRLGGEDGRVGRDEEEVVADDAGEALLIDNDDDDAQRQTEGLSAENSELKIKISELTLQNKTLEKKLSQNLDRAKKSRAESLRKREKFKGRLASIKSEMVLTATSTCSEDGDKEETTPKTKVGRLNASLTTPSDDDDDGGGSVSTMTTSNESPKKKKAKAIPSLSGAARKKKGGSASARATLEKMREVMNETSPPRGSARKEKGKAVPPPGEAARKKKEEAASLRVILEKVREVVP